MGESIQTNGNGEGRGISAVDEMRELAAAWRESPSAVSAMRMLRRLEAVRGELNLRKLRVTILRSFTAEPMVPWLRAGAVEHGLDLDVRLGGFGSFAHEILDSDSELYREPAEVVLLATQTRDWSAALWQDFADMSREEIRAEQNRILRDLETMIGAFRSRSTATLLVHNFELPATPRLGLLDAQSELSQAQTITEMNRRLASIVCGTPGVHLVDYDGLIALHGRRSWSSESHWRTTRLPVSSKHVGDLAAEWLRYVKAAVLPSRKVLVTDLDNTLWGGVLGEDGPHGIGLGQEHPGWQYRQLQRAILDLYRRGILLAVASKNDHADAAACIDTHPEMLLRSENFAATRINWNDKAQSLREIAAELSVGVDSLVFLDDNPVERENIRTRLPEVYVVELPANPAEYAAALQNDACFDALWLTNDDRARNRYYVEQRQRREAAEESASKEDFLAILEQKVTVESAGPATVARIGELTRKTNQLNMTTKRYSDGEIEALAHAEDCRVIGVQVADRFGDNGIVGVAILRKDGRTVEIDTLLLSCRVIGRSVEAAVLSHLAAVCAEWGADELRGWFLPSAKNAPAAVIYRDNGFEQVEHMPGGESLWRLDVRRSMPVCPAFIQLQGEIAVHG